MKVILLRHAPAMSRDAAQWPDDGERPLSDRGRRRAAHVSRGLARLAPEMTAIWSSPAARAFNTAEILRNAHPRRPPLRSCAELAPAARPVRTLEALAALGDQDTVVLVGHEPHLAHLAATLLGAPRAAVALPMKKAGAAGFELSADGASRAPAVLLWWLSPRLLRRIA